MPMNATRKRLLIWLLLASLLFAGLAMLLWPRSVAVDLYTVKTSSLVVTIDETGETRVRDAYVLFAPVTGHLSRIVAEPGDTVIANRTVLASIEPIDPGFLDLRLQRQAQAAVAAAEDTEALALAARSRAVADLDFAEAEFNRAEQLRQENTISIRELDLARHDFQIARAAHETAVAALAVSRHELERARAQLLEPGDQAESRTVQAKLPIRAPVDGTLFALRRESAGIVAAGEALMEIGDTRQLEVVVDLLSTDAVKVRGGQRVIISDWGGEGLLEGRVKRVEPFATTRVSALGIEEQRVNTVIDLTSPKDQRPNLGHGYQLEVRIVLWEGDDVLTIPLTALVRHDDGWAVFVEESGRARLRTVVPGRQTSLEVEIIEGLVSGERIVRYPSNQIRDSVRIVEREAS